MLVKEQIYCPKEFDTLLRISFIFKGITPVDVRIHLLILNSIIKTSFDVQKIARYNAINFKFHYKTEGRKRNNTKRAGRKNGYGFLTGLPQRCRI